MMNLAKIFVSNTPIWFEPVEISREKKNTCSAISDNCMYMTVIICFSPGLLESFL